MRNIVKKFLQFSFWRRQLWLMLAMAVFYAGFAVGTLVLMWQNIWQGPDATLVYYDILNAILLPAKVSLDLAFSYTDFQGFTNDNIFVFLGSSALYSTVIYSFLVNSIVEVINRMNK